MKCSKCGYEYLQEIMSKPMTGDNGIQIMYRCGMCGEIEVEEHLRVKQMIPKSIDKSIDDFKRAKFQAEDEITQIIRKLSNEYHCEIDIDVEIYNRNTITDKSNESFEYQAFIRAIF